MCERASHHRKLNAKERTRQQQFPIFFTSSLFISVTKKFSFNILKTISFNAFRQAVLVIRVMWYNLLSDDYVENKTISPQGNTALHSSINYRLGELISDFSRTLSVSMTQSRGGGGEGKGGTYT